MDVKNLTKEEFLKFLNCSHHSVSTQKGKIVVTGPQKQKLTILKQFGNYTASGVELGECALNHQVLRVPLPIIDIESLPARQVALEFKTKKNKQNKRNVGLSRFGRKLKRKLSAPTRASPRRPIRSLRKDTKPKVSKDTNTKPEVSTNPKNKNNKPTVSPNNYKSYQKIKKLNLIKNQTAPRPKPKQSLQQQMASMYKSLGQQVPPSPVKPQFIIKYVPAEPTYFLQMPDYPDPEDGLLKYPFESLVKDIKNMKLPSTTWKIKVVVKNNKIASIIFTNKCVLERTVSFDAINPHYEIVIENKPAILLGSPDDVDCVEDIEILLNIIHTIDAKDCMIYYKE